MPRVSTLLAVTLFTAVLLVAVGRQRTLLESHKDMNDSSSSLHEIKAKCPSAPHVNRLARETSPYLLQHAGNPVDWYPWGEEALSEARTQNKPIFLSIGYSACHWCHVMERESFEDPQTAKILNEHFIAIKVDREERPDLDEIYMTAVQMMTGRGGWPLSVFLTPDLKPFYGGTYFPPEDRFGVPSFRKVLSAVAEMWRKQPHDIARNAEQMTRALRAEAALAAVDHGTLDISVLSRAVEELKEQFDPGWGGFGNAPKFPPGAAIALLLRQHLHGGGKDLLEMATVTLDRMAHGGIHDQIGGGFHRYSVDAQWLVPHFEKMLYDNAILSKVYLEAWQATGRDLYRRVATGIFDYVLRDMTDRGGGFHSAEDADSEGEEGKFYLWRADEIKAALGEKDGTFFCEYYGVSDEGNFEGRNILHVPHDIPILFHNKGISERELEARLAPLRRRLLAERNKRVRPGKDDKVLAASNGMMISALARGYQILGEKRYLDAAEKAAEFVLTEMVRDGVLLRTYRAAGAGGEVGVSKLPAYLDDYAEMAGALVDLYEATFDLRWLEAAERLARKMTTDFWDDRDGGFFYTSAAHRNLLVRTKPFYDGAVPSGNAVAALVLLRLSKLLDNKEYSTKADSGLILTQDRLRAQPRAHLDLLRAADFYLRPTHQIVVAGKRDSHQTRKLLRVIHGRFIPNKILALAEPGTDGHRRAGHRPKVGRGAWSGGRFLTAHSQQAEELIPLLRGKRMISGKATVYVCENFTCKQPVNDAARLEKTLGSLPQLK